MPSVIFFFKFIKKELENFNKKIIEIKGIFYAFEKLVLNNHKNIIKVIKLYTLLYIIYSKVYTKVN